MANLEQNTERNMGADDVRQDGAVAQFREEFYRNPVAPTPGRASAGEIPSPTEIYIPPIVGGATAGQYEGPRAGSASAERTDSTPQTAQTGRGSAERGAEDAGGPVEHNGRRDRGDSLNGQFDPRTDSTDLRNITQHVVDAMNSGRPLHQTQREITELLQQQMSRGFTNAETRHYFAHLDNMLRGNNTHLADSSGTPRDIFIGLSETKGGWNVSILSNPLDRSQQQIHPTFHVPRR